jgi:hypothetical protein
MKSCDILKWFDERWSSMEESLYRKALFLKIENNGIGFFIYNKMVFSFIALFVIKISD